MVLIGNDNGDFRIAQHFIADTEYGFKRSGAFNFEITESVLAQMVRHGALGRLDGIGLCLNARCHTARMTSPVVQKSRNMHNFFCLIRQT